MNIIIAGTRTFDQYQYLKDTLDNYIRTIPQNNSVITIICGGAPGADTLGEKYAQERGYPIIYFIPNWNKFGSKAGPMRNAEMARAGDCAFVFWNGISKGSRSMIKEMDKLGKPAYIMMYS